MASIVGKALRGFGKALKYHKAQRAASKKVHTDFQTGKPFPKKTQEHMRKYDKRQLEMKHKGFKKEPYRPSGKTSKSGAIKLKEVWSISPHKKAKGGRIGFKRAGPVTKGDLAKRDLWTKRELKRRSQIGQRKSRWDIKGGISGHPLNPLRIHADAKATDWNSKRKDVYNRTRDDLKKSKDPNVKRVAENFQKMDWKDKAKGTYQAKDYEPKLTKRTHVGRKAGGKI